MSIAGASPPGDLPAGCIEVWAQPERNAADTAAVLPANFRKSRLETVDESLPMTYLLSDFGERVNTLSRAIVSAGLACPLNPVNGSIPRHLLARIGCMISFAYEEGDA